MEKEWTELETRAENGQFEDIADYESAMDYPLFRGRPLKGGVSFFPWNLYERT